MNPQKGKTTKSIHDPRYKKLIEVLIDERKSSGLTQAELARRIGRTQSEVSKIEQCERRIDVIEFFNWIAATQGHLPTDFSFLINKINDNG